MRGPEFRGVVFYGSLLIEQERVFFRTKLLLAFACPLCLEKEGVKMPLRVRENSLLKGRTEQPATPVHKRQSRRFLCNIAQNCFLRFRES